MNCTLEAHLKPLGEINHDKAKCGLYYDVKQLVSMDTTVPLVYTLVWVQASGSPMGYRISGASRDV